MTDQNLLARITSRPVVLAGKSQAADENYGHVRPRQGWDEQFQRMAGLGDDSLLDGKDLSASSWDETEWQW